MSADRHRHRLPDPAVPVALGPAHAGRRRAPARRPRPSASTSSGCATATSSLGGVLAGLGGAFLTLEATALVPARDDRRPRVHRPGRDDLRPLDPARRVRGRDPVRLDVGIARTVDPDRAAAGRARRHPRRRSRRSSSTPCRTSSRSSSWPASSGGASRRPPTASRTSARPRPDRRGARARARAAFLDLAGGPRPGPGPRRRRHRRRPARDASDRGRRRVVATRAGRRSASSSTSLDQGFDCVPVNPNERDGPRRRRPSRPSAEAVAATGPFDIVDVFRRSELCVPHAREAVAAGARCLWLQLGVVTGRRPGSRPTAACPWSWTAAPRSSGGGSRARSGRAASADRRRRLSGSGSPRKTRTTPAIAIARADLRLAAEDAPSPPRRRSAPSSRTPPRHGLVAGDVLRPGP